MHVKTFHASRPEHPKVQGTKFRGFGESGTRRTASTAGPSGLRDRVSAASSYRHLHCDPKVHPMYSVLSHLRISTWCQADYSTGNPQPTRRREISTLRPH